MTRPGFQPGPPRWEAGDYYFFNLVCEATGTAVTPDLLCQPRVIVKMIVEKQMECRLAVETEILGEKPCPRATSVHHKTPYDQTGVSTRTAAVGSRRLTAWAMARPTNLFQLQLVRYIVLNGLHAWRRAIYIFFISVYLRGDQAVARPLPKYRRTQIQNKCTQYRHPCLEWDWNPRSQRSSKRRQLMP
jgi:hypothetical protein